MNTKHTDKSIISIEITAEELKFLSEGKELRDSVTSNVEVVIRCRENEVDDIGSKEELSYRYKCWETNPLSL